MELKIIRYTDEHCDAIRDLIVPIQQDEFGIPISYEDQPDLHDIHGFYRKGRGEFWVAIMDTEIVGSIAMLDIGNDQAALRKMFVKKEFRGSPHGTARKLLQCFVGHARASGVAEVYLGTTPAFLAAHRFYEKAGFELIDEQSLPDRFPRMTVDTRFYRLMLVKEPFSSRLQ